MMHKFLKDERGATSIEYAVIAGLIFLAIVAAIVPIGTRLDDIFRLAAGGM
jgi:pilus assembly protein Flp/PilA